MGTSLKSLFGIVVHAFCEPRGLTPEYLKTSQEYAATRNPKNTRLLLPTDKIIANNRGVTCSICHALFLPWEEVTAAPLQNNVPHQKEVMSHPFGNAAMIEIFTKRFNELETRLQGLERILGAVTEQKFLDSGAGAPK